MKNEPVNEHCVCSQLFFLGKETTTEIISPYILYTMRGRTAASDSHQSFGHFTLRSVRLDTTFTSVTTECHNEDSFLLLRCSPTTMSSPVPNIVIITNIFLRSLEKKLVRRV